MKKLLFFTLMCLMAVATIGIIASCDKDSTGTRTSSGGGGVTPAGYVDLGLPSGTKWKAANEGGYYDYDSAIETFGDQLPTREQFEELISLCTYTWDPDRKGVNFVSTVNGKSIFLRAAGDRNCDGYVGNVGSRCNYWSAMPSGSDYAWYLEFKSGVVNMYEICRCFGLSVRLVQD